MEGGGATGSERGGEGESRTRIQVKSGQKGLEIARKREVPFSNKYCSFRGSWQASWTS